MFLNRIVALVFCCVILGMCTLILGSSVCKPTSYILVLKTHCVLILIVASMDLRLRDCPNPCAIQSRQCFLDCQFSLAIDRFPWILCCQELLWRSNLRTELQGSCLHWWSGEKFATFWVHLMVPTQVRYMITPLTSLENLSFHAF
jgi:hypothetical protein